MNIKSFCDSISQIKNEFHEKLTAEKHDFINHVIIPSFVDYGDVIYDESGMPFKVSKIFIIEIVTIGIVLEIIGYRVLKSGYVTKRGFVKMNSMIGIDGSFLRNKIEKVPQK